MHDIHITLDGRIVDLHILSEREYAFYRECLSAYKTNMPRGDYLRLMQSPSNPLMEGKRAITREIAKKPLFHVVEDLEYRLAIRQKIMTPKPDSLVNQEPAQRDRFLSVSEAAKVIDVSITDILKAIKEGKIASHRDKNGGNWKVSKRSLEKYSSTT
ncbi:helix-turn-helix domain-containing protein [Kroppenstedtia pulmonis]|uniref:Helix-turn-helix domain-containing protein n=1 Tax=Kroppenstedtia pulmonis TaxID=1380685 RepID=A0A7D3Y0Z0_9BACL|nr:helix-turn-helix domain-containing protein [Kroppenstedtia pulmonis]QKG84880.1 helix-turn-helix domain-containing protein [Kroppenstedtia pulmonis]